jgi:hypothetical protein
MSQQYHPQYYITEIGRLNMTIKNALTVLGLLSAISFGATAAEFVNSQQAAQLQSAGIITLSGVAGAPSDIRQQLSQKADKLGATAYRVIEARSDNNWHVTAEIYQ